MHTVTAARVFASLRTPWRLGMAFSTFCLPLFLHFPAASWARCAGSSCPCSSPICYGSFGIFLKSVSIASWPLALF